MSKYHKGDRFIVEIKEVMNSDNGTLYRSEFSTLTFDDYGLDKLQKYNEPNPIYIEQAKKCLETETYNKGLEDAWEMTKKIYAFKEDGGMLPDQIYEIFDINSLNRIASKYTPQEALAKFDAYEKAQVEIKVGDVVFNDDTLEEGVVTHIEEGCTFMLYNDGSCGETKAKLTKTGKHIDISSILEQIGGDE